MNEISWAKYAPGTATNCTTAKLAETITERSTRAHNFLTSQVHDRLADLMPPGVKAHAQAITTIKKGIDMYAQVLQQPSTESTDLHYPDVADTPYGASETPAPSKKVGGLLKRAVKASLLITLVAGAFSAAGPAIPAFASPTTLTITTYPQNSTGVPMVAAALTNHVLRGTAEAINMFVNGTLVLECKSRECATDLDVLPGHVAAVTADVGPRGTVPYTNNAIVSAATTVVVTHHVIGCHGTTCT